MPATNSQLQIQLFRLNCLKNTLEALEPISLEARDICYFLSSASGANDLGFAPSGMMNDLDFSKALKPFFRIRKSGVEKRLSQIKKLISEDMSDDQIGEKMIELIRADLKDVSEQDIRQRHADLIAWRKEFKDLLDPSIKIKRAGSVDFRTQRKVINDVRRYNLQADETIPQSREKEADLVILNMMSSQHAKALANINRAIAAKKRKLRKTHSPNPTLHNIALLGDNLGLNDVEKDLMRFFADAAYSEIRMTQRLLQKGSVEADAFYKALGLVLGHDANDVKKALDPNSLLREANLLLPQAVDMTTEESDTVIGAEKNRAQSNAKAAISIRHHEKRSLLFTIPTTVMVALRAENSSTETLLQSLRGKLNDTNDFTLEKEFKHIRNDARRIAANMVDDLLNPEKSRKGRYIAGPAGSGKNALAHVIGQEVQRILNTHHDMDVQVRVEIAAMATSKDEYGHMKAQQLSGRDRIHAHKTADTMARLQNHKTLACKKGEIVLPLIDEADIDMFNPEFIGSGAKDGVKDLFNHHLTNLNTPCLFLLNAAHPQIDHVWRRVAVGLWLDVQGQEGRIQTFQKYLQQAGFDLPEADIAQLASRYTVTPGVIEPIIKDVQSALALNSAEGAPTPSTEEIIAQINHVFAQDERIKFSGMRPIPAIHSKRPDFDFSLCADEDQAIQDPLMGLTRITDFTKAAHSYLIAGPHGVGKRTLVHYLAKQIAENLGQKHHSVLETGTILTPDLTDQAIADQSTILSYNPTQLNAIDETTYPALFARELNRPIFYVVPSDTPYIHPYMSDNFYLGHLDKKAILRSVATLIPKVEIDTRVQLVPNVTLGDVVRLKNWVDNRKTLSGQTPDGLECLQTLMGYKGIDRASISSLGGQNPRRYSMQEAFQGVPAKTPPQPMTPSRQGNNVITLPSFQRKP